MSTITSISKSSFFSLPVNKEWSFANISRKETNYITHGYHSYPAKFIPQIVKKILTTYTKPGDTILDPFGGCGTTLVEAKIMGCKSLGFDINPVAKLITEVKVNTIPPIVIEKSFINFNAVLSKNKNKNLKINHNDKIKYWFSPQTIDELNSIYFAINHIKNQKVKKFYLCAFSHILKKCSRWLAKSVKPQIDPKKKNISPLFLFNSHLKYMIKKNEEFFKLLSGSNNLSTSTKMRLFDSTKRFPLKKNSIDLIITSPPYLTSYEYADLHQLTLFWLGNDRKIFPRWYSYAKRFDFFRRKFVGTKMAKINSVKYTNHLPKYVIDNLPNEKKYLNETKKYFFDINKSLFEMFRVLKKDGKCCIIIGNTKLSGIEIKTAEIIKEQMKNIGFKVKDVIKRELIHKMITSWRDKKNGRFT
ncbi:site-specific DNA-methyltransferase, partial [Patescibacteria group bacterium]|nr:site-specific DNA-methyltransferase [Patescibacteria group bacterium]